MRTKKPYQINAITCIIRYPRLCRHSDVCSYGSIHSDNRFRSRADYARREWNDCQHDLSTDWSASSSVVDENASIKAYRPISYNGTIIEGTCSRCHLTEDGKKLSISGVRPSDAGNYMCELSDGVHRYAVTYLRKYIHFVNDWIRYKSISSKRVAGTCTSSESRPRVSGTCVSCQGPRPWTRYAGLKENRRSQEKEENKQMGTQWLRGDWREGRRGNQKGKMKSIHVRLVVNVRQYELYNTLSQPLPPYILKNLAKNELMLIIFVYRIKRNFTPENCKFANLT